MKVEKSMATKQEPGTSYVKERQPQGQGQGDEDEVEAEVPPVSPEDEKFLTEVRTTHNPQFV